MLEISIKGEPEELTDFLYTLEEKKNIQLITEIVPLVAKRISLYDIISTESLCREATVAELTNALVNHLKENQKNESGKQ